MATDYCKTSNPVRPWTAEETARFLAILQNLPFESYPNGNSGWKDRMPHVFTDAGFVIRKFSAGDPANIARYWFDVAGDAP